jgi:pimeloyl-ACP methyl ester carboxylesterase
MERVYRTSSGLRLAAEVLGDGVGRPPVLLLHGGGQTRHAWGSTAASLSAKGWMTVAIDLRGHGDSEWSTAGDYSLEVFAADVCDIVAALDSPPVIVGASLGGLSALLALAETRDAKAAGLVLVDVAHRFEPDGAHRIVDFMRDNPAGFVNPREASAAVARYLPHRRAPADTAGIEKNLRLRNGRWRWHWDPKLLGASEPLLNPRTAAVLRERLIGALRQLEVPTVLVRGALSDVVSRPIADEFGRLAPQARVVEVDRAAHMVAGDDNDRFTEVVLAFLEELPSCTTPGINGR